MCWRRQRIWVPVETIGVRIKNHRAIEHWSDFHHFFGHGFIPQLQLTAIGVLPVFI
jgi:hypothetical protein